MPVDFEYELSITKGHKDIVVEPLKGEVKGESKEIIKITFTPTACSTAACELELHLSEFDFVPQACRISGSGIPRPSKSPQPRQDSVMEKSKKSSKILEKTDKKTPVGKTLLSLKGGPKTFLIVSYLVRISQL